MSDGGPAVNMHPMKSSYLEAVGQDGSDLVVKFQSGKTFRYEGAGQHFNAMRAAESAGKYFHAHIKGNHPATEVK